MTTGVLLLHGSSGRPDRGRADLLEAAGCRVLAPRWFDREICEIPLESFPIDELADCVDRLCVIGVSRGAEAALLLGTLDDRIDAVVAISPSAFVWPHVSTDPRGSTTMQSSWTWRGQPLPFVPFAESWTSDEEPPAYADLYRESLRRSPERTDEAEIASDRFAGELLLIAGGDDRVWPSLESARRIVERRAGARTVLVTHERAGHRPILPGEPVRRDGQRMARGGSEADDAALGRQAWPEILQILNR